MNLINRLFSSAANADELRLTFNSEEQNWIVKQAGSVVYIGTKEQCQKYLAYQRGKKE